MATPVAVTPENDRELVIARRVAASPEACFRCWTDPKLIPEWFCPKPWRAEVVSMDVRPGGSYKFTFQVDPTTTMDFFGRYLEVDPPRKLVWTNEEGEGDAVVSTATFEEVDGKTRIVIHDLYPSKQALDDAIASESISGWDEQLAQLEALLPELEGASS